MPQRTPPRIDQQVTFLYTNDLEATHRFYTEIMQMPLVLDQGSCRVYRVSGDAFLGFCQRPTAERPDGIIFTLVTQDVDGWHAYLVGRGVAIEKPPTHNPTYNIYQCFVRDPNNYLLEIQTFMDPAWPTAGE